MIRLRPSIRGAVAWPTANAQAYTLAAAVALSAVVGVSDTAYGQAGYLSRDPNVTVDMGVIEELGLPATVTRQSAPADIVIIPPVLFPPSTPPQSRLTGPLANRQIDAAPTRRLADPPPRPAAIPRTVMQAPPPPAAAQPEIRQAAPTPVPPAPEPPPVTAAAPAPAPAEKVEVAPAPPAPPPVVQAPAPAPEPKTADTPAAPAATPPLTPTPVGAAPQDIAPAREPEPEPETAPAETPVETAARPDVQLEMSSYRILFDAKSATISDSARAPLEELSTKMKESEDLRVQLLAYAEGSAETASQARRLSLSRALAVRSFLINEGVRSTRMDVRALGNKIESGPADRVDAVLIAR